VPSVKAEDIADFTSLVLDRFKTFVSMGQVFWDGEAKSVVILRDTGAVQSLMLSNVLPLTLNSSVKASALIQGIAGSYVPVPLQRVNLKYDLVTGPVAVGIVPTLPIDGASFLLGNDLAGDRVVFPPWFQYIL